MKTRCQWSENTFEEYVKYHDEEWGVPVHDDQTHFEFLILESAQAGLSWATILRKRAGYRKAFAEFNVEVVAGYGAEKVEELLQDASIVRNRQKIEATINNAKRFMEVQQEFGSFDKYMNNLSELAMKVDGWSITAYNLLNGKLFNYALPNHSANFPNFVIPILALDVYEHAYVADFKKEGKIGYINTFKKIINWDLVSKRYEALKNCSL